MFGFLWTFPIFVEFIFKLNVCRKVLTSYRRKREVIYQKEWILIAYFKEFQSTVCRYPINGRTKLDIYLLYPIIALEKEMAAIYVLAWNPRDRGRYGGLNSL